MRDKVTNRVSSIRHVLHSPKANDFVASEFEYCNLLHHPDKQQRQRHRSAIRHAYKRAPHDTDHLTNIENIPTYSYTVGGINTPDGNLDGTEWSLWAYYLGRYIASVMYRHERACIEASPDTDGRHTTRDEETGCNPYVDPDNPSRPLMLASRRYPLFSFAAYRASRAQSDPAYHDTSYGERLLTGHPAHSKRFIVVESARVFHARRHSSGGAYTFRTSMLDAMLRHNDVYDMFRFGYTFLKVYISYLIDGPVGVIAATNGSVDMLMSAHGCFVATSKTMHSPLQQLAFYANKFVNSKRLITPASLHRALSKAGYPMLHRLQDQKPGVPVEKVAYLRPDLSGLPTGRFAVTDSGKVLNALREAFRVNNTIPERFTQWLESSVVRLCLLDNNDPKWKDNKKGLQTEWLRLYSFDAEDTPPGMSKAFTSCMRNNKAVAAYGLPGNGLGLLYSTSGSGKVTGRTVVRLERDGKQVREYIRLFYRNDVPFPDIVQQAGYVRGDPAGCRLDMISYDGKNQYLLPYIDSAACYVQRDGNTFLIHSHNNNGEFDSSTSSNGVVNIHRRVPCASCGNSHIEGQHGMLYDDANDTTSGSLCGRCVPAPGKLTMLHGYPPNQCNVFVKITDEARGKDIGKYYMTPAGVAIWHGGKFDMLIARRLIKTIFGEYEASTTVVSVPTGDGTTGYASKRDLEIGRLVTIQHPLNYNYRRADDPEVVALPNGLFTEKANIVTSYISGEPLFRYDVNTCVIAINKKNYYFKLSEISPAEFDCIFYNDNYSIEVVPKGAAPRYSDGHNRIPFNLAAQSMLDKQMPTDCLSDLFYSPHNSRMSTHFRKVLSESVQKLLEGYEPPPKHEGSFEPVRYTSTMYYNVIV